MIEQGDGEPPIEEGPRGEAAAVIAKTSRPVGSASIDLPVVFVTRAMVESIVADAGGFSRISEGEPLQPPQKPGSLKGGTTDLYVEIGRETRFRDRCDQRPDERGRLGADPYDRSLEQLPGVLARSPDFRDEVRISDKHSPEGLGEDLRGECIVFRRQGGAERTA